MLEIAEKKRPFFLRNTFSFFILILSAVLLTLLLFISFRYYLKINSEPVINFPAGFFDEKVHITGAEATELLPSAVFYQKITEVQKNNMDIKAWLSVEGTLIDFAVMQGSDNEKYLYTNPSGHRDYKGAVFFDHQINAKNRSTLPKLSVIYGKNIKLAGGMISKDLFAQLFSYEDKNFANANPYITLALTEDQTTWEIVAVSYWSNSSPNELSTDKFVEQVLRGSIHNFATPRTEDDIYLALISDVFKGDKQTHFIILAKLIAPPNEEDNSIEEEQSEESGS